MDFTCNEFIREPSITRCRTLWHNAIINKRANAFSSNTVYMSICGCFILLEAIGEHDSGWQLNTDLIFKRQNLTSSVKCYWFNYKMLMETTSEKPNSATASLGLFSTEGITTSVQAQEHWSPPACPVPPTAEPFTQSMEESHRGSSHNLPLQKSFSYTEQPLLQHSSAWNHDIEMQRLKQMQRSCICFLSLFLLAFHPLLSLPCLAFCWSSLFPALPWFIPLT